MNDESKTEAVKPEGVEKTPAPKIVVGSKLNIQGEALDYSAQRIALLWKISASLARNSTVVKAERRGMRDIALRGTIDVRELRILVTEFDVYFCDGAVVIIG